MSDYYLYYCGKCKEIELAENDNEVITCSSCGRYYYPLHIKESKWDFMSAEEREEIKITAGRKAVSKRTQSVKKAENSSKVIQEQDREMEQQELHVPARYRKIEPVMSKKISTLSLVGFILSFLGCLSPFGVILGVIDLVQGNNNSDGRRKGLSIAAIVIGLVLIGTAVTVTSIYASDIIDYVETMIEEYLENEEWEDDEDEEWDDDDEYYDDDEEWDDDDEWEDEDEYEYYDDEYIEEGNRNKRTTRSSEDEDEYYEEEYEDEDEYEEEYEDEDEEYDFFEEDDYIEEDEYDEDDYEDDEFFDEDEEDIEEYEDEDYFDDEDEDEDGPIVVL